MPLVCSDTLQRIDGCLGIELWVLMCVLYVIIIIIITAVELSLGGSSPYTSTDKTDKNKYT